MWCECKRTVLKVGMIVGRTVWKPCIKERQGAADDEESTAACR